MDQSIVRNEHYGRSEQAKKLIIADAMGPYLISDTGEKFLDFSSGWCVGNLGWKHPAIEKALRKFDGPTYVSPHFEYAPWVELSNILSEISPGKLSKCFRATGGTEAVEIALQAAMIFTGRDEFIGVDHAYHGNSIAARGLVEDSPFFKWKKLKSPLNGDRLKDLERMLKTKKYAAIIMEPISMNLDVQLPEPEFMIGMQELCREYGTLMIMDEVACGFGRTGKLFATEYFDIDPDIMCLAKALSSGAAPIGATLMKKEIGEALAEEEYPYSTFGWHPHSVTAALATVKYFRDNWEDLEENIRALNEYFRQRLSEMEYKEMPEIRIMGMAIQLDFGKSKYGDKIEERAFRKKLILAGGVSLYPPINLDFLTAEKGLDILESCL